MYINMNFILLFYILIFICIVLYILYDYRKKKKIFEYFKGGSKGSSSRFSDIESDVEDHLRDEAVKSIVESPMENMAKRHGLYGAAVAEEMAKKAKIAKAGYKAMDGAADKNVMKFVFSSLDSKADMAAKTVANTAAGAFNEKVAKYATKKFGPRLGGEISSFVARTIGKEIQKTAYEATGAAYKLGSRTASDVVLGSNNKMAKEATEAALKRQAEDAYKLRTVGGDLSYAFAKYMGKEGGGLQRLLKKGFAMGVDSGMRTAATEAGGAVGKMAVTKPASMVGSSVASMATGNPYLAKKAGEAAGKLAGNTALAKKASDLGKRGGQMAMDSRLGKQAVSGVVNKFGDSATDATRLKVTSKFSQAAADSLITGSNKMATGSALKGTALAKKVGMQAFGPVGLAADFAVSLGMTQIMGEEAIKKQRKERKKNLKKQMKMMSEEEAAIYKEQWKAEQKEWEKGLDEKRKRMAVRQSAGAAGGAIGGAVGMVAGTVLCAGNPLCGMAASMVTSYLGEMLAKKLANKKTWTGKKILGIKKTGIFAKQYKKKQKQKKKKKERRQKNRSLEEKFFFFLESYLTLSEENAMNLFNKYQLIYDESFNTIIKDDTDINKYANIYRSRFESQDLTYSIERNLNEIELIIDNIKSPSEAKDIPINSFEELEVHLLTSEMTVKKAIDQAAEELKQLPNNTTLDKEKMWKDGLIAIDKALTYQKENLKNEMKNSGIQEVAFKNIDNIGLVNLDYQGNSSKPKKSNQQLGETQYLQKLKKKYKKYVSEECDFTKFINNPERCDAAKKYMNSLDEYINQDLNESENEFKESYNLHKDIPDIDKNIYPINNYDLNLSRIAKNKYNPFSQKITNIPTIDSMEKNILKLKSYKDVLLNKELINDKTISGTSDIILDNQDQIYLKQRYNELNSKLPYPSFRKDYPETQYPVTGRYSDSYFIRRGNCPTSINSKDLCTKKGYRWTENKCTKPRFMYINNTSKSNRKGLFTSLVDDLNVITDHFYDEKKRNTLMKHIGLLPCIDS